MKKILILSMTCNAEFFEQEQEIVRETWAADVLAGKYPNIDYYSYTASTDGKYHVDTVNRWLRIPCDDSLNGTAEKTMKCMRLLEACGMRYDYVFRTNTSTYVNVHMLNKFVDTIYDGEMIYTGNTAVSFIDVGPYIYCECFGGNCVLLSDYIIRTVTDKDNIAEAFASDHSMELSNKLSLHKYAICMIDDNCFSFLYNSFLINRGKDHMRYYKKVGIVGNDSYVDYNPLGLNVIAISVRFAEREGEFSFYHGLHKAFIDKMNDPNIDTDSLSDIYEIIQNNNGTVLFYDIAQHTPVRIYMSMEDTVDMLKANGVHIPHTTEP